QRGRPFWGIRPGAGATGIASDRTMAEEQNPPRGERERRSAKQERAQAGQYFETAENSPCNPKACERKRQDAAGGRGERAQPNGCAHPREPTRRRCRERFLVG